MTHTTRKAQFLYAKDSDTFLKQKPFMILTEFSASSRGDGSGSLRSNLEFQPFEPEDVANIRGQEDKFTLDQQGFEFCRQPTSFTAWQDRRAVEEIYLRDVADLIRDRIEGVKEVQIFDWGVGLESPKTLDHAIAPRGWPFHSLEWGPEATTTLPAGIKASLPETFSCFL